MKTITAGDYTIEFDLTPGQYDHWATHYFDKCSLLNECSQFKVYIQNELEKRCSQIENQGYEAEDGL